MARSRFPAEMAKGRLDAPLTEIGDVPFRADEVDPHALREMRGYFAVAP